MNFVKQPLFGLAACLFPLALGGCHERAPRPQPERPPMDGCDASAANFAVGQRYDDQLAERARRAAGARAVRSLFPGQAVTMEYRGDRLNLRVDEQRRVVQVNCG